MTLYVANPPRWSSKKPNRFPGLKNGSVIIHEAATAQWHLYTDPVYIITTKDKREVRRLLKTIEQQVEDNGYHTAGFVSYEAGSVFDKALVTKNAHGFPLLWFGLYKKAQPFEMPQKAPPKDRKMQCNRSDSREAYFDALSKIKDYIVEGDIYQANYTYRMNGNDVPDAWATFVRMIRAQGAGYGAYVQTKNWTISSASPELFFTLDGNTVQSRPMKGTASRGLSYSQDRAQKQWLHESIKNRAENLMIVDMVRNDIGRIADIGSIKVPKLFSVEQYPTVLQMTSLVEGESAKSFSEIFAALFPAASITGTPKARSMQIIDELESTPRKVYTGTIGFYAPNRKAQFNVAIRTLILNNRTGEAEYSVGAGITTDSEPQSEFEECSTKALVLNYEVPHFHLLETLLWEPDLGYFLLDKHLQRLQNSATYLYRPFKREAIRNKLDRVASRFGQTPQRIRLLLKLDGSIEIQHNEIADLPSAYSVSLAKKPIDAKDWTLYHKTTLRGIYKRALKQVESDDVLLWNEKDEITESSIANLIVNIKGELITPPVKCGLLGGVYREQLLEEGKINKGIVTRSDLLKSEAIYLANSVRKMWKVKLIQ